MPWRCNKGCLVLDGLRFANACVRRHPFVDLGASGDMAAARAFDADCCGIGGEARSLARVASLVEMCEERSGKDIASPGWVAFFGRKCRHMMSLAVDIECGTIRSARQGHKLAVLG